MIFLMDFKGETTPSYASSVGRERGSASRPETPISTPG